MAASSEIKGWFLDLSRDPAASFLTDHHFPLLNPSSGPDQSWLNRADDESIKDWTLESLTIYLEKLKASLPMEETLHRLQPSDPFEADQKQISSKSSDDDYDPTGDDSQCVWRYRWCDPSRGFVMYCGRDHRRTWPDWEPEWEDERDGHPFDFTVIDCPAGCLVVGNDDAHPFVSIPGVNWGYSHGEYEAEEKPQNSTLSLREVVNSACASALSLLKRHNFPRQGKRKHHH